jgi:ERCC4-type nuclease
MQVRVVVDIYEREGRVRDALHSLGVPTEVRRLVVGDYEAGRAIIERKTVSDLHGSVLDRRLWRQLARLRRSASQPFLLVEGSDIDAGPLGSSSVRGALVAVSELGIGVVRSEAPADSAAWLKVIAERPLRRRRAMSVLTNGASSNDPAETMLAAVPGLSIVSARALLKQFGSIANIAKADPKSLLSVSGIGPVRAASLETGASHVSRHL